MPCVFQLRNLRVILPYGTNEEFEAIVFLPKSGVNFSEAICDLASDSTWLRGLEFGRAQGELEFPRLEIDETASLLPIMRSLGFDEALNDDKAFGGIAFPSPQLSQVIQGINLQVGELGTESAAATGAVMTLKSGNIHYAVFQMRVDRPFVFSIHHRHTGALLFLVWIFDLS